MKDAALIDGVDGETSIEWICGDCPAFAENEGHFASCQRQH